jgi:hypothetical protein
MPAGVIAEQEKRVQDKLARWIDLDHRIVSKLVQVNRLEVQQLRQIAGNL